ncbi:MAG UNVERIFIED_CONTAM: hypothetical protein LVQ98_02715 [Rickettsiaceae bacterium]
MVNLSKLQKNVIEEMMDSHILKPDKITEAVAEIGIGMGEHFIAQAKANPDVLHIGFEPYLNGIANAFLLAKENHIENIRLWPDDMDLVFNNLPDKSLNRLYILFPDPWPKTKQKKRRLFCPERLEIFAKKLKSDGRIFFASDIEDYFLDVRLLLSNNEYFKLIDNPDNLPHANYVKTKYNLKAEAEGRIAHFLEAVRL